MTPILCRAVLICLLAAAMPASGKTPTPKAPDVIEKLTKGSNQYVFPSGAQLRFARTKDGELVLSSGGRELHRLPRGSAAGQVLESPDRRTVLLLLTQSTPVETPKVPDFTMELVGSSGILRIHSDRKDRIACTMHMTDLQVPEPLRAMTITVLESVLNDGLTVQMQVIRRVEKEKGFKETVVPAEVWDLGTHQRWKIEEHYYDEPTLAAPDSRKDSEAREFYERFDPRDANRFNVGQFNSSERVALVPEIAERFPDFFRNNIDQLFWRAAAFEQVPVCLWIADHGLNVRGGGGDSPLVAVLRKPMLLPVLKRLLELGASPDTEIHYGKFHGPVHGYAFTIRALDALEAMDRLEVHKAVLKRDVVRRGSDQPPHLAGAYGAGQELAGLAIRLSEDGHFWIGAEDGLWRSDGKTIEVFLFSSDPAEAMTTPTMTLQVSRAGLIYDGTTFTKTPSEADEVLRR